MSLILITPIITAIHTAVDIGPVGWLVAVASGSPPPSIFPGFCRLIRSPEEAEDEEVTNSSGGLFLSMALFLPPLHRLNNLKKLLKYSRQRVTPRHPYRHRWICRAVQMDSGKLSLYNAGGEFFLKTKENQYRRVRWIGKCVNSIPPIRR